MGKQQNGYWCERIPSDFGIAVRFRKIGDLGEEYTVLIEGKNSSCGCQGFCRWNHCKHVTAAIQMLEQGHLKPAPRPEHAHEIPAKRVDPEPETCGYCGGQGWVYGPMFSYDGYKTHDEPPQITCEYCGGRGMVEDGSILLPAQPREYYLGSY
jgi:hypothetical protein